MTVFNDFSFARRPPFCNFCDLGRVGVFGRPWFSDIQKKVGRNPACSPCCLHTKGKPRAKRTSQAAAPEYKYQQYVCRIQSEGTCGHDDRGVYVRQGGSHLDKKNSVVFRTVRGSFQHALEPRKHRWGCRSPPHRLVLGAAGGPIYIYRSRDGAWGPPMVPPGAPRGSPRIPFQGIPQEAPQGWGLGWGGLVGGWGMWWAGGLLGVPGGAPGGCG